MNMDRFRIELSTEEHSGLGFEISTEEHSALGFELSIKVKSNTQV